MNYQKTIVAGRVGRDAEVRFTQSGKSVANFSVAVGEKRGGEEETTWFTVTAFDKTAEIAGQYVKKGAEVLVEGRIKTRKYTTKDGIEKDAWEVVCDRLVLGAKPAGSNAEPPQRSKPTSAKPSFDDMDSDIPF